MTPDDRTWISTPFTTRIIAVGFYLPSEKKIKGFVPITPAASASRPLGPAAGVVIIAPQRPDSARTQISCLRRPACGRRLLRGYVHTFLHTDLSVCRRLHEKMRLRDPSSRLLRSDFWIDAQRRDLLASPGFASKPAATVIVSIRQGGALRRRGSGTHAI